MSNNRGRFGIVVSGGPAPGINGVISSCVIEASNLGYETIGFQKGFQGICSEGALAVTPLTIQEVTPYTSRGGSILGISRFNPFQNEQTRGALERALKDNQVDKLIVIGGEGSAFLSYMLNKSFEGIQVVHVPKTIDNDLVLPHGHPSFGFETARYIGTGIIETLIADAKTCERWFLAVTMGRQAGYLALGIGVAAGATITLIPEEFSGKLRSPKEILQPVLDSIKLRANQGKKYGVAILAEGILDCLDPDTVEGMEKWPRDDLGRITYSELELGDVLLPYLKRACKEEQLDIVLKTKNIGYELRCAKPSAFDIEYTRFLGFGAIRLLLDGHSGIMVVRDNESLTYRPLSEIVKEDSASGETSTLSRTVNLDSDFYQVARSFMIR